MTYLFGLTLTYDPLLGAIITIAIALWFHRRVEAMKKPSDQARPAYLEYMKKVLNCLAGDVMQSASASSESSGILAAACLAD